MPQRTLRVGLITFGCRLNQYESQMMRERLEAGCDLVDEGADVYVINACTVTALAERKARQVVHRLKRREPQARIVVVGCLADAVAQGLSRMPGPDLFIGNAAKGRIEAVIRSAFAASPSPLPEPGPEPLDREVVRGHAGHTRAFLKVQDGCNAACTFCRTTQVRGASRSKSVAAACTEARDVVGAGYPEIVLTGINLAQYAAPDGDLPELMRRLLDLPGLRRLRLGSIDASGLTDQLLAVFASDERACPHFHVPLQSGDDEILARMRRSTNTAGYRDRIVAIRRRLADATFGADVIVGFPGESAAAFERTCWLVDEIGFANLHVFRYSPRAGTQAAELSQRVPESEKKTRATRLEALGARVRERVLRGWAGKTERVLIETVAGGTASGYTRGYLPTRIAANTRSTRPGDELPVRVTRIVDGHLEGVTEDREDHC